MQGFGLRRSVLTELFFSPHMILIMSDKNDSPVTEISVSVDSILVSYEAAEIRNFNVFFL